MPEVFTYSFMVRAFIAGTLVGVVAPALGVFLVLRRLSLIADSLSHVALAGVAIGLLTRVFPPLTALATSVTAAAIIERLRASGRLYGEAALALFLYTALAVALVVISLAGGFNASLFNYLFGSIVTVGWLDLWLIAGLAALVLAFIVLFYTELVQTTFDPDLARVSGVPVGWVNLGMAVLTGATVTLSMRVVGVLLVGALMVIPVLASLQVARGFRTAVLIAVGIGVFSVLVGLTAAYYWELAAGGAVVLVSLAVLLAVTLGKAAAKLVLRPVARGER
ncbi:MAG: metal ABC transporter permease [Chloroflexi bacterium]|nr:metal ABC transporter permease [Chloroflexota bacterium]